MAPFIRWDSLKISRSQKRSPRQARPACRRRKPESRDFGRYREGRSPPLWPEVMSYFEKRDSGRRKLHRPESLKTTSLFDGDFRAGLFEDLLDLRGFVLGHAFLDGLRSALDEVLRFLQTERGDLANSLDDVDLL